MNKGKANVVYYMICNDETITEDSLMAKGLTTSDIDQLFDDDILYIENNEYFLEYTEDLLNFAKEKLKEHSYNIADKAIDKCYEYSKEDFEVLTLKFEKEFRHDNKKKDYNNSINCIYELLDVADKDEIKDVNTYIFLLSMLTELPEDLRLSAKYFKLHDLTINSQDYRFIDIDNRNSIRKNIFFQKFSNALRDSKRVEDKNNITYGYDSTLIKMVEQATTRHKRQASIITSLAREDKEEEILLIYEEEQKRRVLTKHEEYIIKLATKLRDIRKNKVVPPINRIKDGRYYDMIDNNDFDGALDRVVEMNKDNPSFLGTSSNYILLCKIKDEINNIKEKVKKIEKG